LAEKRGDGGSGMTIRKVVEVSIKADMADEFLEVASKFIQRVVAREQNTLSYEWFLDESHETCSIPEWYRDDEALLTHLDNIRDLYDQLLAIGEITRLQVFGNASEEVRAAHLQQREFYDYWSGITRVIVDTS